ncbi:hypothetical protein MTO96_023585 [Rhipicephalus appendiculatus]
MEKDGDHHHGGAGGKRQKSSLSKSSHRHHSGRRTSIVSEPEVRVITPANKSAIDAAQQAEKPSRRRSSSSLGSFSEGSGVQSRRTSGGSEPESRPIEEVKRHEWTNRRKPRRKRAPPKRTSIKAPLKQAAPRAGLARRRRIPQLDRRRRPKVYTVLQVVHAERKPSHDVGRSKSSFDKDVPSKAHGEKGAAKSRTSSSSGKPRQASTVSIGGPAVASHMAAAVTPPQDQARSTIGPHVAAKVVGTTSDHTSSKERPHYSTLHDGRASIDHPAADAPLKQNTAGPNASSDSHKGHPTSSAVSDGPAAIAGVHVQDSADAPQVGKAASTAHAPDSKPSDAMVGAPTITSQSGPPVGIAVPAVIEEMVAPGSSHDGKAPSSAHSKDHPPAGPPATSNQEGDKMANRDKGTGSGAPQQGQPPAGLPGPPPPASGLAGSRNRQETKSRHDEEEKRGQHGEPYWTGQRNVLAVPSGACKERRRLWGSLVLLW